MNLAKSLIGWASFAAWLVVAATVLANNSAQSRSVGAFDDLVPAELNDRTPLAQVPGFFIIDPDTGCHYIATNRGGLSPRLAGDGKQICIKIIMKMETIGTATLYCGEALEMLASLPDACVDAIITDPPYSSGGQFRGDRAQTTQAKYISTGSGNLETTSDFGGDNRDQRAFAYWSALWASEALRIARPGSPILLFSDWRQLPVSSDYLQAGGWVWRGIVPWVKLTPRPQMGRFTSAAEYVLWGSAGPMPTDREVGCLPGFYQFAAPTDREHITQKPLGLMASMMEICRPGGTVVNPFMGSGTTGCAAILMGRTFIGCEKGADQFAIACRRLEDAERSGRMFTLEQGRQVDLLPGDPVPVAG